MSLAILWRIWSLLGKNIYKNSFDEEKVVKVHSLCGQADEVERR